MPKSQLIPEHQTLLNLVRRSVEMHLNAQQAGHGLDHTLRVLHWSRVIHDTAGGDLLVVELAALLHDVGDAKFHQGQELGGKLSTEILTELGVVAEVIERVVNVVDNLSFRKGVPATELSLEGQIVQDADRLDALGAIGIVRTIEFGCFKGQAFHTPEDPRPIEQHASGIGHFFQKLFHLRSLLNTETARQLAKQRERIMYSFVEQFLAESACSLSLDQNFKTLN